VRGEEGDVSHPQIRWILWIQRTEFTEDTEKREDFRQNGKNGTNARNGRGDPSHATGRSASLPPEGGPATAGRSPRNQRLRHGTGQAVGLYGER